MLDHVGGEIDTVPLEHVGWILGHRVDHHLAARLLRRVLAAVRNDADLEGAGEPAAERLQRDPAGLFDDGRPAGFQQRPVHPWRERCEGLQLVQAVQAQIGGDTGADGGVGG